MLPNYPLLDQAPPSATRHVAKLVVRLACLLGPAPLAARGLAAVLARAGPAAGIGAINAARSLAQSRAEAVWTVGSADRVLYLRLRTIGYKPDVAPRC